MKGNFLFKFAMYIQSLLILMIILLLLSIKTDLITNFWFDNQFLIASLSVYILLLLFSFYITKLYFDSSAILPEEIKNVNNKNFDSLTYLFTNIIPLVSFFNGNNVRSIIVLVFLLIVTGILFIKTNLFYVSPVLILFNYSLFEAETKHLGKIVIIAKKKLRSDDLVKLVPLGSKVYLGL